MQSRCTEYLCCLAQFGAASNAGEMQTGKQKQDISAPSIVPGTAGLKMALSREHRVVLSVRESPEQKCCEGVACEGRSPETD